MCTKQYVGLKRNWTPLEAYKYKWPQPHLYIIIIIIHSYFLGLARTVLRLIRRSWFAQVQNCRVRSSHVRTRVLVSSRGNATRIFGLQPQACRLMSAVGGFQRHTRTPFACDWKLGFDFSVDRSWPHNSAVDRRQWQLTTSLWSRVMIINIVGFISWMLIS